MRGALVRLGHSLAPVKIWACRPPRGQNMLFWKMRFRWVRFHFEVVRNRAKFCMFWPLKFFWNVSSTKKVLDRRYKILLSTDHRAKFHADRPMHLGDLALKKINKTSGVKLKSSRKLSFKGKLICGFIKVWKVTKKLLSTQQQQQLLLLLLIYLNNSQ